MERKISDPLKQLREIKQKRDNQDGHNRSNDNQRDQSGTPRSYEQFRREDEAKSKDAFNQRTEQDLPPHEMPGPGRDGLPEDHEPSPQRRSKDQKPESRREKTQPEKSRLELKYNMKGPIGRAVDRQMHYQEAAADHANALEKNKHLLTGKEQEQTPKFEMEQRNTLGSIFEKAEAKEKTEKGNERPDDEHTR